MIIDSHIKNCATSMLVIGEAMEHFPKTDFSDITIESDVWFDRSGASFWPDDKILKIGINLSRSLSFLDFKFIIAHELRHIQQFKEKILDYDGPYSIWTPTNFVKHMDDLNYLIKYNKDEYNKIPWEADANGFAHAAMNYYIPENAYLANSIKWCTTEGYYNSFNGEKK